MHSDTTLDNYKNMYTCGIKCLMLTNCSMSCLSVTDRQQC